MTKRELEKSLRVLTQHNRWRRGEKIKPGDPAEIGRAIDVAIRLFREHRQEVLKCG
jgi:hypothetical protein